MYVSFKDKKRDLIESYQWKFEQIQTRNKKVNSFFF